MNEGDRQLIQNSSISAAEGLSGGGERSTESPMSVTGAGRASAPRFPSALGSGCPRSGSRKRALKGRWHAGEGGKQGGQREELPCDASATEGNLGGSSLNQDKGLGLCNPS